MEVPVRRLPKNENQERAARGLTEVQKPPLLSSHPSLSRPSHLPCPSQLHQNIYVPSPPAHLTTPSSHSPRLIVSEPKLPHLDLDAHRFLPLSPLLPVPFSTESSSFPVRFPLPALESSLPLFERSALGLEEGGEMGEVGVGVKEEGEERREGLDCRRRGRKERS